MGGGSSRHNGLTGGIMQRLTMQEFNALTRYFATDQISPTRCWEVPQWWIRKFVPELADDVAELCSPSDIAYQMASLSVGATSLDDGEVTMTSLVRRPIRSAVQLLQDNPECLRCGRPPPPSVLARGFQKGRHTHSSDDNSGPSDGNGDLGAMEMEIEVEESSLPVASKSFSLSTSARRRRDRVRRSKCSLTHVSNTPPEGAVQGAAGGLSLSGNASVKRNRRRRATASAGPLSVTVQSCSIVAEKFLFQWSSEFASLLECVIMARLWLRGGIHIMTREMTLQRFIEVHGVEAADTLPP